MALNHFSQQNSSTIFEHIDYVVETVIPDRPPKLVRQTNEWINYFGQYPIACAEIVSETKFQDKIGRTGNYITRHILQSPVNSRVLSLSPTRCEVATVQRQVRDKANSIYAQLEIFADNGLITMTKVTGGAKLTYQGNEIFIKFYIVEETSMFHATISKSAIYFNGVTHPEMDDVSSLMYCLRMIFITPGLFVSFDFELNAEDIQRASSVTFELSLIQPEKEEEPAWLNDENADWTP
jgi:hypothetical protein